MVFPSILNAGEVIHIRAMELNHALVSYTFYSNTGESLSTGKFTLADNQGRITAPHLPGGMYYLTLSYEGKAGTFPVQLN